MPTSQTREVYDQAVERGKAVGMARFTPRGTRTFAEIKAELEARFPTVNQPRPRGVYTVFVEGSPVVIGVTSQGAVPLRCAVNDQMAERDALELTQLLLDRVYDPPVGVLTALIDGG